MNRLDNDDIRKLRGLNILSVDQAIYEIVANSVDAGADEILVKIDFKSLSFAVIDNGHGMSSQDLGHLQRHCTSKISHWNDIPLCETYGFRGESLDNIRQLSRRTVMISSQNGQAFRMTNGVAERFEFDNDIINPMNNNMFFVPLFIQGTAVIVHDMYADYPVRFRSTQSQGVAKLVEALKYRLVQLELPKFSLVVDGTCYINRVEASSNRGNQINDVYNTNYHFTRVKSYKKEISLEGWLSHSEKRDLQFLFINQRLYKLKLGLKRHPIFWIRIGCKIREVEPMKEITGFAHEQTVLDLLASLFSKFYGDSIMGVKSPVKNSIPFKRGNFSPQKIHKRNTECIEASADQLNPMSIQKALDALPASQNVEKYTKEGSYNITEETEITRQHLEQAIAISQVKYQFILVKLPHTIAIIDQHAADERVRLEEILKEFGATELKQFDSRPAFSEIEVSELNEFSQSLSSILKVDNGHITHMHPFIIQETDIKTKIFQHIDDLKCRRKIFNPFLDDISNLPDFIISSMNSKACRQAVKFGDKLGPAQMSEIITKLSKCRYPFICAHGRPTIVPLASI